MKNPIKKIKKTWTLDPKTVAIIKELAAQNKRKENVTVDILIQEAARQAANS